MKPSDKDAQRAAQSIEHWKDVFASDPDATKYAESFACPPEPSPDEQIAPEDPDFMASCRADVIAMNKGPVTFEDQLLTRSPTWGLIWRADYSDPKNPGQLYPLRVACWKNDNGEFGTTISGQQHPKLKSP